MHYSKAKCAVELHNSICSSSWIVVILMVGLVLHLFGVGSACFRTSHTAAIVLILVVVRVRTRFATHAIIQLIVIKYRVTYLLPRLCLLHHRIPHNSSQQKDKKNLSISLYSFEICNSTIFRLWWRRKCSFAACARNHCLRAHLFAHCRVHIYSMCNAYTVLGKRVQDAQTAATSTSIISSLHGYWARFLIAMFSSTLISYVFDQYMQ